MTRRGFGLCPVCWNKYLLNSKKNEIQGMDVIREMIRIRDCHKCQSCWKEWIPGQRRFDIHHLNGLCGKRSRSYDKVRDIENCITLCHKCHLNLEEVKYKMATRTSPRKNKPVPATI